MRDYVTAALTRRHSFGREGVGLHVPADTLVRQ